MHFCRIRAEQVPAPGVARGRRPSGLPSATVVPQRQRELLHVECDALEPERLACGGEPGRPRPQRLSLRPGATRACRGSGAQQSRDPAIQQDPQPRAARGPGADDQRLPWPPVPRPKVRRPSTR